MGWKECVGCREPTLLTLYCYECFKANFKKKPDARRVKPRIPLMSMTDLNKQMEELKKLLAPLYKDEK